MPPYMYTDLKELLCFMYLLSFRRSVLINNNSVLVLIRRSDKKYCQNSRFN